MQDGEHAEWATTLRRLSEQRAGFAREIIDLGHDYGDDVDESGTATAALHRGWIAVKDALTGSSPEAVLRAAVTGEDHAVAEYEDALKNDISPELRTVLARQAAEVKKARDRVKALADQN